MSKLPQISGKEMARVLLRLSFEFKSQKGSHMKFIRKHSYGKEVVIVPNHKILRPGTLANILGKLNLDAEKLKDLM
ncbi:MAG: type II toxin-antitoxin system HicA family toxin [Candidatus Pacebacteria bacterium]|nr:type II toxin-antitoxin system HicA family toxin [Candidatus Paceibacterota bacterium]NUQ57279.1 type II toxin-antitoxin system HicA family toxin [Candidatus Paceibacter sp.]